MAEHLSSSAAAWSLSDFHDIAALILRWEGVTGRLPYPLIHLYEVRGVPRKLRPHLTSQPSAAQ